MDDCHGAHAALDRYLTGTQYVLDMLRWGKITSAEAVTLHSGYLTKLTSDVIDAFVTRLGKAITAGHGADRTAAEATVRCERPDGPVFPLTDPCSDAAPGPASYEHPARHPAAGPADNTYECSGCGCACLHPSPQEGSLCSCPCEVCDCADIRAESEMG